MRPVEDGSRLATVESLVDQHSLAIDQSVFVIPPPPTPGKAAAYAADDLLSTTFGTGDKLFIDGHYYSDKSPVPALGMGLVYWIAQRTSGLLACDHVDVFCRLVMILTSGLGLCGGRRRHVLALSRNRAQAWHGLCRDCEFRVEHDGGSPMPST